MTGYRTRNVLLVGGGLLLMVTLLSAVWLRLHHAEAEPVLATTLDRAGAPPASDGLGEPKKGANAADGPARGRVPLTLGRSHPAPSDSLPFPFDPGRKDRAKKTLELLRTDPGSPDLADPTRWLHPFIDPEEWEESLALWEAHLADPEASVEILQNGAMWLALYERDWSMEIAGRLQEQEADNPEWHALEAHLHTLDMDPDQMTDTELTGYAEAARDAFAQAIQRADEPEELVGYLAEGINTAALAGDWEQCEAWAQELLETGAGDRYGGERHKAHQGLGLAALRRGDTEGAIAELLQMGSEPPGAVQRSFGPSMLLARDLLERGEDEAVLQYLAQVERYWSQATVAEWRAAIEAGDMPEFGANLRY